MKVGSSHGNSVQVDRRSQHPLNEIQLRMLEYLHRYTTYITLVPYAQTAVWQPPPLSLGLPSCVRSSRSHSMAFLRFF
jgi:hypothetical protein